MRITRFAADLTQVDNTHPTVETGHAERVHTAAPITSPRHANDRELYPEHTASHRPFELDRARLIHEFRYEDEGVVDLTLQADRDAKGQALVLEHLRNETSQPLPPPTGSGVALVDTFVARGRHILLSALLGDVQASDWIGHSREMPLASHGPQALSPPSPRCQGRI